jgi:uncharacterized protein (TIGR03790 family)
MNKLQLNCLLTLVFVSPAAAIEPAEVVLLVNRNLPESLEVGEHYRMKRGVPKENLIILDLPKVEDISRQEYDARIVAPVRAALKERKGKIKVLLCIYGVPLRVGGKQPNDQEKAELAPIQMECKKLQDRIKELETRVKQLEADARKDAKSEPTKELPKVRDELKKAQGGLRNLERRRNWLSYAESHAAVDNELMLLWWDDYELRRFLVNPLHFQAPEEYRQKHAPVMMTARLDGPTPEIARRLVDDAMDIEKVGLRGKVYVDARDNRFDPKSDQGYGYGGYDESMREMAALLKNEGKMEVVLDNKPEVFKPGSCPECALYCGWYSHGNFVDSCGFVKGAVAWHLASSEAVSLRRKDSKLWCANILLKGACATLGPVAEPYTVGFPKPEEFFGFLATGEFTLVECYARTLNLTSWMCTLIGDPLYNPYKATPKIKKEQVHPSPKGGRFMLPEVK